MRSDHKRVLVAGVGNVFHGDDAFGVEVVTALAEKQLPDPVRITDFGIRTYDLAFAMLDGYETVIFVDAAPRGKEPGTVFLLEVDATGIPIEGPVGGHSMDPQTVRRLVEAMGGYNGRVLLVGCEPATIEPNRTLSLSAPARDAVAPAIELIFETLDELLSEEPATESLQNTHVGG